MGQSTANLQQALWTGPGITTSKSRFQKTPKVGLGDQCPFVAVLVQFPCHRGSATPPVGPKIRLRSMRGIRTNSIGRRTPLVTSLAPDPINLYGLVPSMAPNTIHLLILLASMAPNPINLCMVCPVFLYTPKDQEASTETNYSCRVSTFCAARQSWPCRGHSFLAQFSCECHSSGDATTQSLRA